MSRDFTDDFFVRFVQCELGSVWALKAMLALRAQPTQRWSVQALVRELRANSGLVTELLERFAKVGLVAGNDDSWSWQPTTGALKDVTDRVAEAYAVRPVGIIQLIAEAPQDVSVQD